MVRSKLLERVHAHSTQINVSMILTTSDAWSATKAGP